MGPLRRPPPLRSIAPACLCLLTLAAFTASPIIAQAQATDTPPAAQDLRQTALGFRNAQDFDKAIEIYEALLAENPPDALSIKVDLGLCYKAKKDYSNAMPLFTEVASSQDKLKAQAMFFIEDCCCEQGKIADAVAELTKAYDECPDARVDVLLRRAARQCDIQRYEEALADYRELLRGFPNNEYATTFRIRIADITFRLNGKTPEFTAALQAAADAVKAESLISERGRSLWRTLGRVFLDTKQWEEAAAVYRSLVQQYPRDSAADRLSLGLACKGLGDYPSAMALLDGVERDEAGGLSSTALLLKEDCLTEQHKCQEAVDYLTGLLAEHPELRESILSRRAARNSDLKHWDEALSDLAELQSNYPDMRADATLGEGLVRLAKGNATKDEAEAKRGIEILERFQSDFPDQTVLVAASRFHLGIQYVYSGTDAKDAALKWNPEKGRSILREGAENLPVTMYTWWMKVEGANSYVTELRFAETAAACEALLSQSPPASWDEYLMYLDVSALLRTGKTDPAKAALRTLADRYPNGHWTRIARNIVAAQAGD